MTLADSLRSAISLDHTSLADRAYREIEELIVTLKLAPGGVLSESVLAKGLGIGRTPIREALQRLALEGLIVIMPRRGIFVSEINVKSQLELLKLRREVERLMTRLAAERTTNEERRQFLEIGRLMRASAVNNDDVGFMRLDQQFNHLLAHSCRNDYARRAMALMDGLSRRFWYMHYKEALDLGRSANLHADIAEPIGRGDADEAAAACDRHIDYLEGFTRASLD